jgi:hypothetical protein
MVGVAVQHCGLLQVASELGGARRSGFRQVGEHFPSPAVRAGSEEVLAVMTGAWPQLRAVRVRAPVAPTRSAVAGRVMLRVGSACWKPG